MINIVFFFQNYTIDKNVTRTKKYLKDMFSVKNVKQKYLYIFLEVRSYKVHKNQVGPGI